MKMTLAAEAAAVRFRLTWRSWGTDNSLEQNLDIRDMSGDHAWPLAALFFAGEY